MRVWVTRPLRDATKFAERLSDLGYTCVCAPLFEPNFVRLDDLSPAQFDAVVVTSRNGVRALRHLVLDDAAWRDLPTIVVGPGSAELAADYGQARVIEGAGTAKALAQNVPTELQRLVYLRAAEVSIDLAAHLAARGHTVISRVAYRMAPTGQPDASLSSGLARGEFGAVTLFSPGAAALYAHKLTQRGLRHCSSSLKHYCFSHRVSDQLSRLQLGELYIATQPNLEEMLALIAGPAAQSVDASNI